MHCSTPRDERALGVWEQTRHDARPMDDVVEPVLANVAAYSPGHAVSVDGPGGEDARAGSIGVERRTIAYADETLAHGQWSRSGGKVLYEKTEQDRIVRCVVVLDRVDDCEQLTGNQPGLRRNLDLIV